ncbi:MAG: VTT domain-containing protein [Vicinamibacterales bacterium]
MHHLAEFAQRIIATILPIAERLGGPGLFLIAAIDASFLSLPESGDTLVILLTIQHPGQWWYYALMSALGSVAGCWVIYEIARKGGQAILKKRLKENHIEHGLAMFRRFGMLAIVVPAMTPPPMPFKLFVLVAGIADIRPWTFCLAVFIGRMIRFGAVGWLAYRYGEQATALIHQNLPAILTWLAIGIVVVAVVTVVGRRRRVTA